MLVVQGERVCLFLVVWLLREFIRLVLNGNKKRKQGMKCEKIREVRKNGRERREREMK